MVEFQAQYEMIVDPLKSPMLSIIDRLTVQHSASGRLGLKPLVEWDNADQGIRQNRFET